MENKDKENKDIKEQAQGQEKEEHSDPPVEVISLTEEEIDPTLSLEPFPFGD